MISDVEMLEAIEQQEEQETKVDVYEQHCIDKIKDLERMIDYFKTELARYKHGKQLQK